MTTNSPGSPSGRRGTARHGTVRYQLRSSKAAGWKQSSQSHAPGLGAGPATGQVWTEQDAEGQRRGRQRGEARRDTGLGAGRAR